VTVTTISFEVFAQLLIRMLKFCERRRVTLGRRLCGLLLFFDFGAGLIEKRLKYKLAFGQLLFVVGRDQHGVLRLSYVGRSVRDQLSQISIDHRRWHYEFNLLGLVVAYQVHIEDALASSLYTSEDRTVLNRILRAADSLSSYWQLLIKQLIEALAIDQHGVFVGHHQHMRV
jgi:hypothetical protein